MHRTTLISSAVLLFTASLAACGGGDDDAGPSAVAVGDTVALTASAKLISFNRAAPASLVGATSVRGLAAGETLLGLSLRPADGRLHAVSSAGKVYTVDASTGVATLKSTLAADPTDTTDPFVALVAGASYGVDFNPTVDRLRLVSSTGQNLRINVDTGATTTDTPIALAGAAVRAVAYTNSFDGATATQLYDLNAADGSVYLQNPPNNGALATPVALGVTFSGAGGFDIDPATQLGYAALTVGGASQFYRVDLNATTNAATLVGAIAGNEVILGLALVNPTPTAPTALGLTADNRLVAFSPRTPNTLTSTVAIAAPAGESVVGIDIRPSDGLLYAVTQAADNIGHVYTVNPTSGAVSPVATISVPLAGSVFSVDFNPMANALRVLSASGQSLAVNLTTAPGTATVNGAVNLAGAASPSVIGAAYLNSGVASAAPAATALYSVEASNDVLATQVVATGTLTVVGALGRDVAGRAGFDIAGSRNGIALLTFGTVATGPSTLYEVNLTTGATALPRGLTADTALVGGASGPALRDLAIRF